MKAWLSISFIFLFGLTLRAQSIKIGILSNGPVYSTVFQAHRGSYEILGDDRSLFQSSGEASTTISISEGLVSINHLGKEYGRFRKVLFLMREWDSEFRLKPLLPAQKEQRYQDNLLVTVKKGSLQLLNEAQLEHYVAGVVEAETGRGNALEFYKVQAVISRTYALSNKRKHEKEGFHLCDQVHCQVYHGKARFEPLIIEATEATKNHVLVDHNIQLITAAFHSNCGGQTLNAEKVWSKHLPYLIGKTDTFCLAQSQSHWEKTVPLNAWTTYLSQKGQLQATDSLNWRNALAYYPSEKESILGDDRWNLPMTEIRKDMKLRSSWFSIQQEGDQVRFVGRGFGHSVGLCQEGAMQMAIMGFSCTEIIHFYYTDVHLIDLSQKAFFEAETPVQP